MCPGVFLNTPNIDMRFVRYATEVEYARRMSEMLCTDISYESNVVALCLSLL